MVGMTVAHPRGNAEVVVMQGACEDTYECVNT
jgi:hypothetical protein